MSHPRMLIAATLVLILSACNLSSSFSLSPATEAGEAPEVVETQAQPEKDSVIEDTQISAQVQPTLMPEPTTLPPEVIAEADAEELLLINLYQRVNPSVVNIVVTVEDNSIVNNNNPFPAQGQGSGFIVDNEGHIVTNNHVINEADEVEVTFFDGSIVEAEVVGADPDSDLAIIKVDVPAESLRPIIWADSDQILVGQRAVAIGNPFGLDGTLTTGIISALGRSLPTENRFRIPEIIQTDAAINPGNSGGPLLNSQGEVIGVNTAIVPNRGNLGERSFLGVGFAVPANLVRRVTSSLIEDGEYQHPWIGFQGHDVTPDVAEAMKLPNISGAIVTQVLSGSPADDAGLRGATRDIELDNGGIVQVGGDIIIGIDGEAIAEFNDLLSYLSSKGEVDKVVALTIIRDGKEQQIELTLGARPSQIN